MTDLARGPTTEAPKPVSKPYEREMQRLIHSGDTEGAHAEADQLLVQLLRLLGYDDLCDLYAEVPKWFA